MGVFSVYTGIVYNDIFSRSFNIFGSSWTTDGYTIDIVTGNAELTLDPYTNFARLNASPYPIGLDPIWQVIFISAVLEFLAALLLKIQEFLCVNHAYQQT
jgi:V-type H+-transporting ATPase subunit a